tara:strand:+ start:184 stop:612 length:429 start_codon:yes stop_codon:yes gene_type:complete
VSEIFVDTIRKTGGSLGTDIRIKNTSVYESDGGTSVTQNLVKAVSKMYVRHNQANSVEESLNQASITDNGTADYTSSFTNNMADTNYIFGSANEGGTDYYRNTFLATVATSSMQHKVRLLNQTYFLTLDIGKVMFHLLGDLA